VRKPILYITRKEHFNAAHKLYNAAWTPEQNEEVFGKCANANWHGHNFDLYVTVKGTPNPDTGFIMDLKLLKRIIREEVIDHLDHRNLNEDVPFLKGVLPSIEHIAMAIWERVSPRLPSNCSLHKVLLYETEQNFVEFYGEF
jgi:6-pyruvoyltetrahydropterin/6-carboxytetrahydropterin synthase